MLFTPTIHKTRGQHVRKKKKLEEKGRKGSMVEDKFPSNHIILDSVIKKSR
jgi:hypothetical protein